MVQKPVSGRSVCVVGLGSVGTPLAEAFAEHIPMIGFDIDTRKVHSLIKSNKKCKRQRIQP